jgi:hypothetical protein
LAAGPDRIRTRIGRAHRWQRASYPLRGSP